MKNQVGFVYLFSLSDRQDIVKIGETSEHPEVRASNLSKQTGASGNLMLSGISK